MFLTAHVAIHVANDSESGVMYSRSSHFWISECSRGEISSPPLSPSLSVRRPDRNDYTIQIQGVGSHVSHIDTLNLVYNPDAKKENVIDAVKANVLPHDDEEAIIILSAASPQELVGIRALVGKYESTKKIVLVNCRTKPLPRELVRAQTVYSVLPLVAKPTETRRNPLPPGSSAAPSSTRPDNSPPRVVILRRFPRDWEIFVDTGTGFELAATVPATSAEPKGPTLPWVVGAVQRYLQARSR